MSDFSSSDIIISPPLANGYLLSFNSNNGNLNNANRISKNGISSEIIFLDDNMLFIDNNNKLLKFN